jgi:predicted patatin/cPLA2 family phospholipase
MTGLVLEGGAMRGLFSAGITDVWMEAGIEFDGLIGVSAGAAFGCNIKSRQPGRAIRYNKRFARDPRYSGWRSLWKSGDIFNAQFAYHEVPAKYDIFDDKAFDNNPLPFYVVCTDVESGQPVYKQLSKTNYDCYEWIRASASMPVVSKVVELEGMKLLDGGITDSIPLEKMIELGYERNVVILTQPEGYVKKPNRLMPLIRLSLRKYPNAVKASRDRHLMYNRQLEYVRRREKEGNTLVIRPDNALEIGHIEHDAAKMQKIYDIGRKKGEETLKAVKDFLKAH